VSDLDRLLAQVEELKRLAMRPDDSWMNSMSTEELQSLGKRVRKVADGLSGLQSQMIQKNRGGGIAPGARPAAPRSPSPVQRAGGGSLGNIVRRDSSGGSGGAGGSGGMDMSNPMGRRRSGGTTPPEAPPARRPGGPASSGPAPGSASPPKSGWKPPWQQNTGDTPPGGGRGRNRPSF